MFFDVGWSELLLIGGVALVVIGPKDLPQALRVAGHWVRKARGLSREFQSNIEQMMREAELDEMRRELKKATELDLEKEFHKTIGPMPGEPGSPARSIAAPPTLPEALDGPGSALAAPSPLTSPPPMQPIEAEPEAVARGGAAIAPGAPVFEPPPVHGFDATEP